MKDLISVIKAANGSLKLELTGEDLLAFSNELINRAKSELSQAEAESRKEKYLTKEETLKMLNVCDTTLWHWNKRGYLKNIKVGSKVLYRKSDIAKIMGEKDIHPKNF